MKIRFHCFLFGFMLATICGSYARAADIDIYFRGVTPGSAAEPMVMFSLDWRANIGSTVCNGTECDFLHDEGYMAKDPSTDTITLFDLLRAVLKRVMEPLTGIKVGLMMTHQDVNGSNTCNHPDKPSGLCNNGGFIAYGFKSMGVQANKDAFHALLDNVPLPGAGKDNKYQASEMFFEFFRYLTGGPILNAHSGMQSFDDYKGKGNDPADPTKPPDPYWAYRPNVGLATLNLNQEPYGVSWDTSIETVNGNNYISPLVNTSECTRIFTVNIIFGTLNHDSNSVSAMQAAESSGGLGITLPNQNNNRFGAVLNYLNNRDLADGTLGTAPDIGGNQNVISYFLAPSANNTENYFAAQGGSVAALTLSEDPEELIATLENLFKEILSVSTTFVAASVPVNAFNRTKVDDSIYLAIFQPKQDASWPGNMKKLRALDDGNGLPIFADARDEPAVAADGRIKFNALTYWTDPNNLPFDSSTPTNPDPNVTGDEADKVVDERDGRFVSRGGAGQKIPGIAGSGTLDPGEVNGTNARKLFTQSTTVGDADGLLPIDADDTNNVASELQSDLTGAATEDEALCLLKYIRGYNVDVVANVCNTPDPLVPRTWTMGDLLHSRPATINYGGSATNPDIRILFGSNDGFFRMVRDTDSSGNHVGNEVWAFMPREVMGIIKTLADNQPLAAAHPYGVDGSPVVYTKDLNYDGTIDHSAGDKAWVFFGLRRGGKSYYGLDVSDPDNPELLWSISNTGDFAELGLTFSKPSIGSLRWGGSNDPKPVVVAGGGYDLRKDPPASPLGAASTVYPSTGANSSDSEGNAIFVIDAETGDLVWKAVRTGTSGTKVHVNSDLKDSIVADIALLDSNNDSVTDRGYVGDTGGVVWRINFISNNSNNWTAEPILSVGRHAPDGLGNVVDRRFYEGVDFAYTMDEYGDFDAVIIGSGDRENPLEDQIANEFYMFKDRLGGHPQCLDDISNPAGGTHVCESADLADLTSTSCLDDDPISCSGHLKYGWKMDLPDAGEKALASSLTANSAIFFSTYLPPGLSVTQCGPQEGTGRLYALDLQTSRATNNFDPTNDSNGVVLNDDDRGRLLASGGIPAQVIPLPFGRLYDITKLNQNGTGDVPENLASGPVPFLPVCASDLGCEDGGVLRAEKTFWYQETE